MGAILIQGGRVIDPASGRDETADVLLDAGIVREIGRVSEREAAAATGGRGAALERIDAEGCLVTPGLVDPHVHFREPGFEHKETIATGAASAAAGGFTTVCCMPNTNPPLDRPEMIEFIRRRGEAAGICRVFAVAAATVGRRGEAAGPIADLARAGAVGFTDDGDCVADPGVLAAVLARVRETGLAFMQHCQDAATTLGGVMNAGPLAIRLGLLGWPAAAEESIIERDVRLNRDIGCPYHVQHISSAGSIDIIRRARQAGQPVTAEAAPHHLLLTEDACSGYDPNTKMNPPLRRREDIAALREGIAEGVVTILATDHAPHTEVEKERGFSGAPFGVIGLECALALYARALVEDGVVDWPAMIRMMTAAPAALCGLHRSGLGRLERGGPADVTIIDPDAHWIIDPALFASRSRNCPFAGWRVRARAVCTILAGRATFSAPGAAARYRSMSGQLEQMAARK
jgi:dihydroorotase